MTGYWQRICQSPLRKYLYWSPLVIAPLQLVDVCYITGQSMQPTLNPDTSPTRDIALFEGLSTRLFQNLSRGDIVYLTSPTNSQKHLVKRIVAVPGDSIATLPPYPEKSVTLPPHHFWVEGDEWFHSDGSNHFGPVHIALIRSKLVWILWPLNRFGTVKSPDLPDTTNYDIAMKVMAAKHWQARVTPSSDSP